jgi:hypothetical protein
MRSLGSRMNCLQAVGENRPVRCLNPAEFPLTAYTTSAGSVRSCGKQLEQNMKIHAARSKRRAKAVCCRSSFTSRSSTTARARRTVDAQAGHLLEQLPTQLQSGQR